MNKDKLAELLQEYPHLKYFIKLLKNKGFKLFPEPCYVEKDKWSISFTKFNINDEKLTIEFTPKLIDVDYYSFKNCHYFNFWKKVENKDFKSVWKDLMQDDLIFNVVNK